LYFSPLLQKKLRRLIRCIKKTAAAILFMEDKTVKKKVKKVISDEYEEEVKGRAAIVYGAAGAGSCTNCPYLTGSFCSCTDACPFRRV
jgi:hypothetical protein